MPQAAEWRELMKFPAIKEHHLYNKAYRSGKHFFGRYIRIYVLKDLHARKLQREHPKREIVNRLGLSVSKKVGGAVKRNRAKRIIRAAYGEIREELKTGFLVVVSAKPEIDGKLSTDVLKEMRYAMKKLDMLKEKNELEKSSDK